MTYVTQGTIQIKKTVGATKDEDGRDRGAFTAVIRTVADYHVKHGGQGYSILMNVDESAREEARARTDEEEYDVAECIGDVLTVAASRSIAVEVEIEIAPGKPPTIVAVRMPATVTKQD